MANGLFNLKQVVQAVQQGGWPAQKPPSVEYLVVAGGGGGGESGGGGGGAGGLLTGLDPVPNGQTLLVTVGGGGAQNSGYGTAGNTGSNSVFGNITALGGGGGGAYSGGGSPASKSGGSGGGGGSALTEFTQPGGQGTSSQGNAGGIGAGTPRNGGAGGGGAGTVGLNPIAGSGGGGNGGRGGAGIASAISGTVTVYAGGGGGGSGDGSGPGGVGGVGGGGTGGYGGSAVPTAGTANTGGGGGGDWNNVSQAGIGGSGIVIVSYPDTYAAATATTGSPTVSTSGSGSVLFNGSTQYISTASVTIGTGNFTFETWSYIVSNGANYGRIFGLGDFAGSAGIGLNLNPSTMRLELYINNTVILNPVQTYSYSTWYHFAIVRSGATITLYANGVSQGTASSGASLSGSIYVSAVNYTGSIFYGASYTSNYRVTTNAVYTANFTPSTIPLTSISGTILLLNTVSGAPFADNSGTYTPTAFASPTWNQLSPFTGTGYKNRVYTWTSSGTITF